MKTKEFFDYLQYIGVTSDDNFYIMSSLVEKKTKENENNKELEKNSFMKSLMGEYFITLNKEQLEKLGSHIYDKYIINKSLTISKHLLRLLSIKEDLLYRKLKSFFILWKNILSLEKNVKPKIFHHSASTDKLFGIPLSKQKNMSDLNLNNINSINKNIFNNINFNNQFLSPNFLTRLEKYNNKREYDKRIMRSINDDDITNNCTFTPNLSLTRKRNNKFRKKFEISKHTNIESPCKIEEKPKKKVDKDRMYKLYTDFQRKNINKEKLKKNIDKENGITFTPKLNVNSQYNKKIKDNFFERNQKLLNDKKNFINGFNLLRDLQMKGVDINQ